MFEMGYLDFTKDGPNSVHESATCLFDSHKQRAQILTRAALTRQTLAASHRLCFTEHFADEIVRVLRTQLSYCVNLASKPETLARAVSVSDGRHNPEQ